MLNYSWKQYLLSIILIGLIIVFVNKFSETNEEFICAKFNSFKSLEFNGVVKEKLVDKNDHNNRIVIYVDETRYPKRLDLSFDGSNLFKDINVGDSVFKQINSAEVLLNKNKYKINFSVKCD